MIEKCIIAGVKIKQSRTDIDYEMEELKQLVEASGGIVVYSIVQEKDNYTAATYLGKGKVEEIRILCEETDATLVVVNDELTGSQINNLEKMLDVRVIDRTMLILDIFALRAKTKESKLQVELAQLKYTMPRLKGKGIEMSKLGGGIGTRGPGEKKLETDRRHIETNIHEIEKQLKKAKTVRDVNRKSRVKNNVPVIAVIGYTNAGKSTLINCLLNLYCVEKDKEVFVYDMLFATLTTENRKLKLLDKYEAIITDTVGFISKLPTKLIESFKSTLEEINFSDIIIHLMDVTNEDLNVQKETTDEILKEIKATDIPVIEVYNKIDKTEVIFRDSQGIYISAKTGLNIDKLVERILLLLYGESKIYTFRLSYSDHTKLSFLENHTNIIEREYLEDGIKVVFETREKIYEKL
ncbi:MAG TPA: GTPase HflX [Clostridiales bacterium]|nr:GTPase HflX [Clostridiales bacterium]